MLEEDRKAEEPRAVANDKEAFSVSVDVLEPPPPPPGAGPRPGSAGRRVSDGADLSRSERAHVVPRAVTDNTGFSLRVPAFAS